MKKYLFVIGVDKYEDNSYEDLPCCKKDAEDFESLMINKFGFEDFDPFHKSLVSEKATFDNILAGFQDLKNRVTEKDSLLIYYSGHGDLNKQKQGFWIPYDAKNGSESSYISNARIRDEIKHISSKHTLLISDSCFSEKLLSAHLKEARSNNAFDYWEEKLSRWVFCSGRGRVAGGKEGENSAFTKSILTILEGFNQEKLNINRLADMVSIHVGYNYPQVAVAAPLFNTEHDGGQFIFKKKLDKTEIAPPEEIVPPEEEVKKDEENKIETKETGLLLLDNPKKEEKPKKETTKKKVVFKPRKQVDTDSSNNGNSQLPFLIKIRPYLNINSSKILVVSFLVFIILELINNYFFANLKIVTYGFLTLLLINALIIVVFIASYLYEDTYRVSNKINTLKEHLKELSKGIGILKGNMRKLKHSIDNNNQELDRSNAILKKAIEIKNSKVQAVHNENIQMLESEIDDLENQYNIFKLQYKLLITLYSRGEIILDSLKRKLEFLKPKFTGHKNKDGFIDEYNFTSKHSDFFNCIQKSINHISKVGYLPNRENVIDLCEIIYHSYLEIDNKVISEINDL